MGAGVGLLLGLGLACLWWAWWAPPGPADDGGGPPRRRGLGRRLRDLLTAAGVESVSPAAFVGTCLGCGAAAGLLVAATSRSVAVAVAFGTIAAAAPVAVVRGRARRRASGLRDVWPEAVDNLASAVRAGLSLPEALVQLADRGPEVLRPAFVAFGRDYRSTGRFDTALDALEERLADPVADRVCEALRVTREVGGTDLGRLLRSLSAFLRADARTRAEIQARQSWTVNGARLAVAAPWLMLALLATDPAAVRPYDTPDGAAVLAGGAIVSAVAYRLMLRLARLPEDARVLR